MKRLTMVVACAVACAGGVFGQEKAEVEKKLETVEKILKEEPAQKRKITRAEIELRPEVQRRTGGFVDSVARGTAILVLDQRRNPGGAAGQFKTVFERLSKYNVCVEKKAAAQGVCPLEMLRTVCAERKAVFGIAVIEDAKAEGLAVFPEARLAVVNAAKFRGGDDPVKREERVLKEIWRGYGFVAGLGYAPFKNDVLQPVFDVAELDALEFQVMQPMNFQKSYRVMSRFGATRSRHVPYRLAVKEGWAQPPTNQYQKAVWDQVHALPKNPMKIEFDPKKGR